MATAMLLLAALPSALGFAASPGRLFLGRSASGVSVRAASGVPARSPLRPARFGAGGARMMSTPTETAKAEKDTSVVLNPDFTFKMDDIVSVCKRRGFVFQSSEIYNGFNGFYDYGPLGVELKNNIKKIWWRDMVHRREDVVGLDSSIIASPKIWQSSGHVEGFSDPMVDCKVSKQRFRADQMWYAPVALEDGEELGYVCVLESGTMQ
ncbi:hypothetical protein T484DRAFT_1789209, partial [Baffinella frigidus]